MTRSTCAFCIGVVVFGLTGLVSASPPWTTDGNCTACHAVQRAGILSVENYDTVTSPDNLKVFQVEAGQTRQLSAMVGGLLEGDRYMVMLKGFANPGVQSAGSLAYQPDCAWAEWWRNFFTDPPRSDDPSYSYLSPSGPGAFQYSVQVAADCPSDYYPLTFAVVGVPAEGADLFYAEEQFYLQVSAPTPTDPMIGLNKTSMSATAAQGASPAADSFTVSNTGAGTLSYTITDSATWLTVTPTSGTSTGEADTISVQYSTTTLAAGSYSATITVTDPAALNNPQTISVSLTIGGTGGNVAAGQTLYNQRCIGCHSSPASLAPRANRIVTNMSSITSSHNGITLTTQQVADLKAYLATFTSGTSRSIVLNKTSLAPTAVQGSSPANDTFTVARGGQGTLSYSITDNATWLTVSPTSGTSTGEADTIAVQYNTASLAVGSYSAAINVSATGATNTPQTVNVSLTITSTGGGGGGGSASAGQTLYTQRCVSCHSSPTSLAPAAGRITTNMSSITPSHNGITLTAQQVADLQAYLATFSSSNSPIIVLDRTSISRLTDQGTSPTDDVFTVTRGGQGTLNYTITDNANWLSVSPASGSSAGEADTITVQYNTASMAPGSYSATITVSGTNAANSPQAIEVTLTIAGSGGSGPPVITVDKTTLTAWAQRGRNARSVTFTVRNSGGGRLSYRVADNVRWMTVSPRWGVSNGEADTITVQFSTSYLRSGSYTGTITVSDSSGVAAPKTIRVSLNVGTRGDGDPDDEDDDERDD